MRGSTDENQMQCYFVTEIRFVNVCCMSHEMFEMAIVEYTKASWPIVS